MSKRKQDVSGINLYSLTRLNGWTSGRPNRKLSHKQRTPQYYEYARTPQEAKDSLGKLFTCPQKFDAVLVEKNTVPPSWD
jgi:hypothetical protein